jgi:Tripartite tricarboxylate transporter family receptor
LHIAYRCDYDAAKALQRPYESPKICDNQKRRQHASHAFDIADFFVHRRQCCDGACAKHLSEQTDTLDRTLCRWWQRRHQRAFSRQETQQSNAPAQTDTIAGQTQMMFDTMSTVLQQVKAQRLRALAVTSLQRSPFLAESGFPNFEMAVYLGVLGPASMPREIVNRLNAEIVKITREPEARAQFAQQSIDLFGSTPEELGAYIKTDIARWEKIIREAGIKPQ